MDYIQLERIEFYGYHGALAEEQKLGQRFVVSLRLYLDLAPPGRADELTLTVNYAAAYYAVRDIVENKRFSLLEALAEQIAQTVLTQFPVMRVVVEVQKPAVPIAGILAYAAVCIDREKKR